LGLCREQLSLLFAALALSGLAITGIAAIAVTVATVGVDGSFEDGEHDGTQVCGFFYRSTSM